VVKGMLSAYELILLIGIILTILFIHYNNRGRRKIIEEQVDLENVCKFKDCINNSFRGHPFCHKHTEGKPQAISVEIEIQNLATQSR
tara:strand:- start:94 stop:354 length:261 start_codon:yes stop_codon:yes gene_type:complete